jgi:hypothetical protein
MPAVASRMPRLDPLALPVRFTAHDAAADGRVRLVEIDRDRVLLSRSVRGMAIRVRVPVKAFRGVAATAADACDEIVLRLEHSDPALSVELFAGRDDADAAAEWELWGRVLGLPLLSVDVSGETRAAVAQIGFMAIGSPAPRRRRRNAIKRRRSTMALRRKSGRIEADTPVHREREIIARN